MPRISSSSDLVIGLRQETDTRARLGRSKHFGFSWAFCVLTSQRHLGAVVNPAQKTKEAVDYREWVWRTPRNVKIDGQETPYAIVLLGVTGVDPSGDGARAD